MLTPMNRHSETLLLALSIAVAIVAHHPTCAADKKQIQRQPIDTPGTTELPDQNPMGGLSAPGANALMTQDMLLVNPNQATGQTQAQPLKAYIGNSVTMQINRYDIDFDRMNGILVTVVNDTDRPLVVNGEKAVASNGGKTHTAAPVSAIQDIIVPPKKAQQILEDFLKDVVPAAATIGAYPTIKDLKTMKKPVLERYGADELRRRVEASRFGRRVLWPRSKTTGVLYFDTEDDLDKSTVEIPVSTLFDMTDAGSLVASGIAPPAVMTPPAPMPPGVNGIINSPSSSVMPEPQPELKGTIPTPAPASSPEVKGNTQ